MNRFLNKIQKRLFNYTTKIKDVKQYNIPTYRLIDNKGKIVS